MYYGSKELIVFLVVQDLSFFLLSYLSSVIISLDLC